MAGRDGFLVAVKPSAVEANDAARTLAVQRGERVRFESRRAAEAEASRLSEQGATPVAIQRAAPQDPDDVDAYLLARPERRTHDPIERDDGRLTFETTAAQYGALGETLVCSYGANPPLLSAYVRADLDDEVTDDVAERLWIDVDRDPEPVVYSTMDAATRLAWVPDCVARARDGPGGPVIREYFCEVKTGDASYQRDQSAVMAYAAREATVLKVRVDVDPLPDAYTARAEAVAAEDPPAGVSKAGSPNARLDDFG